MFSGGAGGRESMLKSDDAHGISMALNLNTFVELYIQISTLTLLLIVSMLSL